ncbi:MAG: sel1 repeat family protein [Bacteroides sp.]|nr:sel1 repeat family protein [Bacteroides sp.]
MKKLLQFSLAVLMLLAHMACSNRPKVVSPIEIPNLDSLKIYVDKAGQTEDATDQYFAALYYLDQHSSSDTTKAIELLTKSAKHEFPFAAVALGNIYSTDSMNSLYDIKKAVEYYEVGVKNGSDRAMTKLANLYIDGKGVQPDYNKALQLRSDAILGLLQLAEKGDMAAQWRLGCNLIDGIGVATNASAGLQWIKRAADKGFTPAYYSLGLCYANGMGGLEKNPKEAFNYIKKAADKEHPDALYRLGKYYDSGFGVERSEYSAFRSFKKAAELGNTDAMFDVALAYHNGNGTITDYQQAFNWYKKLADMGNTSAQNNIGSMYDNGQGVVKDKTEAFKWFMKAAQGGAAFSMRIVGGCYFEGNGVDRDITKAFEWWKKAAEAGDITSMENLAVCYGNGLGTTKDTGAANYWSNRANTGI